MSRPFWDAAHQHRLVVQRCRSCNAMRYPPLVGCPECLSRDADWIEVRPAGSIWSYAVYHRCLHEGFAGEVPYTIVAVDLLDGPRMIGRLAPSPRAASVGAAVVAEFIDISPEVTLPGWRLAPDS